MKFMSDFLSSPISAIFVSIVFYAFGVWLFKKTKLAFIHPLPVASILIISLLGFFHVDYDLYNKGGQIISVFLGPATVCLAIPLYKNLDKFKKNIIPILAATAVGSVVAVASVVILGIAFNLDRQVILSVIPRSVTVPIGLAISSQLGGMVSITMLAIVITGTLGTVYAPYLCKWFKIKDDVANGLAFGTSSHAVGTAKAMEINELMGSMAGLSIASVGIITLIIAEIIQRYI
jgi:predicted murein hydrolase (TIGR00659 family)